MNKKQVEIISNDKWNIDEKTIVKLEVQGDKFATLTHTMNKSEVPVKKISKTEYIDKRTGEVMQYKKKSKSKDNIESLRNTFKKLTGLIRTNFENNSSKQLFITLTYKENMTDRERLYKDFDKFYKNLKYKYRNEHKFEYIVVAEPQGRGAWHLHLMLKSNNDLRIDYKILNELWPYGYTDVQRLKSDDVGCYYVSYFTNLESEIKEDGTPKNKRELKGSRLKYYPQGMRLYRNSRGLKKPVTIETKFEDVLKEYGRPIWQKQYTISTIETEEKEGKLINVIHKATFKKTKK